MDKENLGNFIFGFVFFSLRTQLKLAEWTLCFCCWLQTDLMVLFRFMIFKLATATPQNQQPKNHA